MSPHPDVRDWPRWRKRVETRAVQIHSYVDLPGGVWTTSELGFEVPTSDGTLHAVWGSWLAQDARGYFYPIADAEFRLIYEPVPEDAS